MENKTGFVLALGLVIVAVIVAMAPVRLQGAEKDKITVTGNADLMVPPDKAELYITVETNATTALEAQQLNSEASSSVRSALSGMGVNASDIETDSYAIMPKEVYDETNGVYKVQGYTAVNTLKLTTRDINGAGKYIDATVAAGANRVDRVVFSLTKQQERTVSEQLLKTASSDAQQKAASIAKSLGVPLGKIIDISESNYNVQPFFYSAGAAMAKADTTVSPKNIEVTATITLSYQI